MAGGGEDIDDSGKEGWFRIVCGSWDNRFPLDVVIFCR